MTRLACVAEARVQLSLGRPACHAVVCACGESSLALGGVLQLRYLDDEWRAHRRTLAEFAP